MKFKVTQISTEAMKSSHSDLKNKHVNVHKTKEEHQNICDFLSSEGQLGVQICIEKALGIRF